MFGDEDRQSLRAVIVVPNTFRTPLPDSMWIPTNRSRGTHTAQSDLNADDEGTDAISPVQRTPCPVPSQVGKDRP